MKITNIEEFFLNTLLRISIAGVFLILVSNILFFPEDSLSISISAAILSACIVAYLLRNKFPTGAVLTLTSVALLAMTYQRLTSPATSTTLSVVLIVGFIVSVMLKGSMMWIMHCIAFIVLNTIFVVHVDDKVTAAITYSTLYFILTYATAVLKSSYDRMHQDLLNANGELHEKADNLNSLNSDLEKIVNERTAKIQIQNEKLIKYSYSNAHHVRGPVATLLGLASIYKLDPSLGSDYIIEKMVDQAKEIDLVIRQINIELDSGNVGI